MRRAICKYDLCSNGIYGGDFILPFSFFIETNVHAIFRIGNNSKSNNMTPNTDASSRLINTIHQQTSSPDITFASSTKPEALNTKFRPLTKYILLDHNYNFHTLSLKKRTKYTQEIEIFLNKKQKYNIRQKIKTTQSESFRNEL